MEEITLIGAALAFLQLFRSDMMIEKLRGLSLSMEDEALIENFTFSDEFVIATIGRKDMAVCAPVLSYDVISEDALVIDKDNFDIRLENIQIKDDVVLTIRNGIPTIYKVVT